MKKFLLFTALAYFTSYCFATVRTVSNDLNIPAQFTNFDIAYTVSSPGDTIYLHGSSTAYSLTGGIFNKPITVIGAGFNPDKQYRLTSTFNVALSINISNVYLFGIYDNWGIFIGNGVTNCRLSRCFITGLGMSNTNTNIIIDGDCFGKTSTFGLRGNTHTIQNCLINNFSPSSGPQNCTIDHNTFMQTPDFTTISNSWVSNNLFYMGIAVASTNIAYNNNLVTGPGVIPGAGNTGAGNINAPVTFVDYVAARPFYFYNNFDLTVGSAGNNVATDGTDVGAYGGGNPYAQEGEVKTLPIIREMDIMTPVVPSPGNINVHIRATQPK